MVTRVVRIVRVIRVTKVIRIVRVIRVSVAQGRPSGTIFLRGFVFMPGLPGARRATSVFRYLGGGVFGYRGMRVVGA